MTKDDVLFGYRLQLFALAAERGFRGLPVMGVHRSTTTAGSPRSSAPAGDAAPARASPPDAQPALALVEQRIVAFALGQPG